jgi:hypothetical protein
MKHSMFFTLIPSLPLCGEGVTPSLQACAASAQESVTGGGALATTPPALRATSPASGGGYKNQEYLPC